MAQTRHSLLIREAPRRLWSPTPAGGDYRYEFAGGYLHMVLLSPRALEWFQQEVYADVLEWGSPTEPRLRWGGETAELLREMRMSGLRKARDAWQH
jgi:hypothetical protein